MSKWPQTEITTRSWTAKSALTQRNLHLRFTALFISSYPCSGHVTWLESWHFWPLYWHGTGPNAAEIRTCWKKLESISVLRQSANVASSLGAGGSLDIAVVENIVSSYPSQWREQVHCYRISYCCSNHPNTCNLKKYRKISQAKGSWPALPDSITRSSCDFSTREECYVVWDWHLAANDEDHHLHDLLQHDMKYHLWIPRGQRMHVIPGPGTLRWLAKSGYRLILPHHPASVRAYSEPSKALFSSGDALSSPTWVQEHWSTCKASL